jgi:hypothetical protein
MKLYEFLIIALLTLTGAAVFGCSAHADMGTVTPAGVTQGTATTVNATDTYVSSAAAGAGVIIKATPFGQVQTVTNGTANMILVYPPSGANFNGLTTNAAVALAPNSRLSMQAYNNLIYLATINQLATNTNVGTVTTVATTAVQEIGGAKNHTTILTMTAFAIGNSGDNASLGIGAKFYTWPTGVDVLVTEASIDGGVTCAISVTTDTPEVGIGSVIASGAIATLTTGTFENLVDGGASGSSVDAATVAPDVAGTVFRKKNLTTVTPIIKASGGAARDLFLNVADGWADVTAAGACTFTGTITLNWQIIG